MNTMQAELIGAVETLQSYCDSQKICEKCVFDSDGYCFLCEDEDGIHKTPDDWDLKIIRAMIFREDK